jgi:hypothetical protein
VAYESAVAGTNAAIEQEFAKVPKRVTPAAEGSSEATIQ